MLDLNRLNKEQREAAEHIEGPLLVMAGAGTGKALANNTKVLTDKGYIPIGRLMINDKVYGKDGELHNVIGVFPQVDILPPLTEWDSTARYWDCASTEMLTN